MKGRGTDLAPGNRFETTEVIKDMDYYEQFPDELEKRIETTFIREHSKNVLSQNDSPDLGFGYSINPYKGCEHGCIYCYARPSHEYWGFNQGVDFETKIMYKPDAASLLEKTFRKESWQPQVVIVSGNTDCYQPGERKFQITRRLLEVFLKFRNPLGMITKNSLIERDLDLLEELAKLELVSVTISITTLDRNLTSIMEPRTSRPERRLKTVEALAKRGIKVGVNIAPIVPGINDKQIPEIMKAAAEAGAKSVGKVILRLPYKNKDLFVDWVIKNFPDRKDKILNRIKSLMSGKLYNSEFHERFRGSGQWAETINQIFYLNVKKYKLNQERSPLRTDLFIRNPDQMDLF